MYTEVSYGEGKSQRISNYFPQLGNVMSSLFSKGPKTMVLAILRRRSKFCSQKLNRVSQVSCGRHKLSLGFIASGSQQSPSEVHPFGFM